MQICFGVKRNETKCGLQAPDLLPFPWLRLRRAQVLRQSSRRAERRNCGTRGRKDVGVGVLRFLGKIAGENETARVFLYISYTLAATAPSSACACACAARCCCTAPRVVTRGMCRSGSTSANPSRATDDLSITSDVQGSLAAARRITVWVVVVVPFFQESEESQEEVEERGEKERETKTDRHGPFLVASLARQSRESRDPSWPCRRRQDV